MQTIWIGKAIVSFQTPEFLKVQRHKYFYTQKFVSAKWLYRIKPQKRYKYFNAKKFESTKRLYCFKLQKVQRYKYFYTQRFVLAKRLYCIKPRSDTRNLNRRSDCIASNSRSFQRWSDTITFIITFIEVIVSITVRTLECMSAVFLWGGGVRGFTDFILP